MRRKRVFDLRQYFEAPCLFSLTLETRTWLCFNILCRGTFVVLRQEFRTLLEEIWFWNKCYERFKTACCSCMVHYVPCYPTHAPAVIAADIYLWARSHSRPWIRLPQQSANNSAARPKLESCGHVRSCGFVAISAALVKEKPALLKLLGLCVLFQSYSKLK